MEIAGERRVVLKPEKGSSDDVHQMMRLDRENSRLRAGLGARGLSARLAASHFDGFG